LEILSGPDNEEYENTVAWLGEDFDPEFFDLKDVAFSDPEARWQYAFGNEDDLIGDEVLDGEDEIPHDMRWLSRNHMHQLWEKVKGGDLEGLSTEEKALAGIMLEHKDEFFNEFEFADLTYDREYDPETEVNPFLHICIHSLVENQLGEKDPIEVFQFYNAMRKKKCSHHESIHLIGAIFAPLMFSVMKEQEDFDVDTYGYLLRKYKNRNPEKIFDLLSQEGKLYPLDS